MKRLLFSAFFLSAVATANADSYGYLVFEQADGSLSSLTANGLKITFADGKLSATSGSETLTFPLSSLSAMRFSNNDVTGIEAVETTDESGESVVYNLSGMVVARGTDASALTDGLAAGVYIVKSNGKTSKIRVK